MKTKVILILTGILIICCVCSGLAGFALYKFAETMSLEYQKLNAEVLTPVCKASGNITGAEYQKYFNASFRKNNSLAETNALIREIFPESYSCSDLNANNVIELIQNNMGYSFNQTTGGTYADIDFVSKTGITNKIKLIQENDTWQIYAISITTY